MKLSSSLHRRLHWLNLPTALLLTLLQRTPAVRVVAAVEELVVSSPLGAVLKSFAATAASLGAMHSLVGATPLVPSSGTATDLTVTVGTPVSVAYGVTGTQTPAMSWTRRNCRFTTQRTRPVSGGRPALMVKIPKALSGFTSSTRSSW